MEGIVIFCRSSSLFVGVTSVRAFGLSLKPYLKFRFFVINGRHSWDLLMCLCTKIRR